MCIVGSSISCDIQTILFVFKEMFHMKVKTRMCTIITCGSYMGKPIFCPAYSIKRNNCTADNQLNAKPRLSKDVRLQHFRFHKEDAINVNKVYLFRIPGILMDINLNRK